MDIFLREYREKAGMSQAEIANILGISKTQVNLYEQAPETLTTGLLMRWLQILEVDMATVMTVPTPPLKAVDAGTPYAELHHRLNLLNQYVDAASPVDTLDLPTQSATPKDLKKQLKLYKQKPNVVLTGGFDAGKSHMANALLGSTNLPVGYQPATRVITFIRHVEDRPEWFKQNVLIFEEDFWLKDEKGKQLIDLQNLDNKERCEQYCLQSGSFDILQRYGVHGSNEDVAAHAAVIYMASPILKACNLIDLPGYSDQPDEQSKDFEKANSAAQIADVLLYASPAKGHINGQDMIRLGVLLRLLPTPEVECDNFPTLGNFFIVATHADPSIRDRQLPEILDKAAKRLFNNLAETALERRQEQISRPITETDLRKRFFTFWSEKPGRCQNLFNELTQILGEFLPQARMCRIEREIKAIKEDNVKKYNSQIEAYQATFMAEANSQLLQLQSLQENEPTRQQETELKRNKIHQRIKNLKQDNKNSFQRYVDKLLNVDRVEQIILDKYSNKKEAKEYLFVYLIEKLQNEVENIIRISSEELNIEIDAFLEGYTQVRAKIPNPNKILLEIPFDAKGAFLGGLAGLTSIGAMSAWAATLGNLGGYILVAQLVSLLSALGIGFGFSGGTAGVIAFVAAIGGPIVLAIGLAAVLAFSIWGLFGESWQKRLAKETVKYFIAQKVCEKFTEGINQYWQDTIKGFDQGADAVETKWRKHLEHLREIASPRTESKETSRGAYRFDKLTLREINSPKTESNGSKEHIEKIIKELKVFCDFFAKIPW